MKPHPNIRQNLGTDDIKKDIILSCKIVDSDWLRDI